MANGTSGSARGGSLGGGGGLGSLGGGGQGIANQAPNASNVPIAPGGVTDLTKMTDDDLAKLIMSSKNIDMPNHLADVHDATQSFVYAAGLNAKPMVLDKAAFNQYLSDNGIPRSQILSRSTGGADYVVNGTRIKMSPQQVTLLIKDGELNYVGGKHGGQAHGAGTYFDMNGGRNTGYANGATMIGVLNPKTARPISHRQLDSAVVAWSKSHPKANRAIGGYNSRTASIYASCMGYNVITNNTYHNVIDRVALVMQKENI